jgi:rod shape determining protein RodA
VQAVIGFTLFSILLCGWIKYEAPIGSDKDTSVAAQKWHLPTVPILEPYQKERIRVFLSDDVDTADAGWNKLQAQVAVGSGGLRGKGYLQGTQNMLGFLPRTVAPTDFIFCVIAEEMGFIGSISILLLYMLLLGRCLRTAWRARDEFGRMVALGISTLLFCHIFINIAMTIGLLPITGLPLPLMSYGGSFMISTLVALGIIQSIYQRRRIR